MADPIDDALRREMDEKTTNTPDQNLISAAIRASGLSVRRFAADVLTRDARTVWRWLAGENALPRAVRERCETILANSPENSPDFATSQQSADMTGGAEIPGKHDFPGPDSEHSGGL